MSLEYAGPCPKLECDIREDMIASALHILRLEPELELAPADLRYRFGFTQRAIDAHAEPAIAAARRIHAGLQKSEVRSQPSFAKATEGGKSDGEEGLPSEALAKEG